MDLYQHFNKQSAEVEELIEKSASAFKGTYSSVNDLSSVDADANDYAWVSSIDGNGNTIYSHYRYTEADGWVFEYTMNSSNFSDEEWAAIQSGATKELIEKLSALPTNAELAESIDGKVDKVSGKVLSTNDYTDADKAKLDGIEAGAQKNTVTSVNKKTGAVTISKSDIGLGNVDNTSDAKKQVYESNVMWGDSSITGGVSVVDAGIINTLSANRFAFMPADAITVEYSRDAGETWLDYGATDKEKVGVFSNISQQFVIGKADLTNNALAEGNRGKYMLRFIIGQTYTRIYCLIRKIYCFIGTNGSGNCYMRVECKSKDAEDYTELTTMRVSGWSGWNSCFIKGNYTISAATLWRITFYTDDKLGINADLTRYTGLHVYRILGFGYPLWSNSNGNMVEEGHIYSYDWQQNVTFPANVTANGAVVATNVPSDLLTRLEALETKVRTLEEGMTTEES